MSEILLDDMLTSADEDFTGVFKDFETPLLDGPLDEEEEDHEEEEEEDLLFVVSAFPLTVL